VVNKESNYLGDSQVILLALMIVICVPVLLTMPIATGIRRHLLTVEIFNRIGCKDKGRLKYWSSDIKCAKFLLYVAMLPEYSTWAGMLSHSLTRSFDRSISCAT